MVGGGSATDYESNELTAAKWSGFCWVSGEDQDNGEMFGPEWRVPPSRNQNNNTLICATDHQTTNNGCASLPLPNYCSNKTSAKFWTRMVPWNVPLLLLWTVDGHSTKKIIINRYGKRLRRIACTCAHNTSNHLRFSAPGPNLSVGLWCNSDTSATASKLQKGALLLSNFQLFVPQLTDLFPVQSKNMLKQFIET